MKELDLVAGISEHEEAELRQRLEVFSPDDGKYAGAAAPLKKYLTPEAEWLMCARLQLLLLETRAEFGQASDLQLQQVKAAIKKADALNMSLLEREVTKHDQLAVIEEIGRFLPSETKALLHPGTTSYDILDTARSYLFREAWYRAIRPKVKDVTSTLCDIAEQSISMLQVGRTHLQHTSPVTFGSVFAGYASRLTSRIKYLDTAFSGLKGKVSGIVGTGASIEMVVGGGKALKFEEEVLKKLGMKPDYTSTQVVQKEALADVGHGIVALVHVLGDLAGDIRLLYASDIGEVTSRDNAQRLGGSSADASKNNPINWENIEGKVAIVESGMRILYAMIGTDMQRDLRSSVQARYQPQQMMVQTYEMFCRALKTLKQLSTNEDRVAANLDSVRRFPSEAMVAILRGTGWTHTEYGTGHDFVKEMSKRAKAKEYPLLQTCLEDEEFRTLFKNLPVEKQQILKGNLDLYLGAAVEKTKHNIAYARSV